MIIKAHLKSWMLEVAVSIHISVTALDNKHNMWSSNLACGNIWPNSCQPFSQGFSFPQLMHGHHLCGCAWWCSWLYCVLAMLAYINMHCVCKDSTVVWVKVHYQHWAETFASLQAWCWYSCNIQVVYDSHGKLRACLCASSPALQWVASARQRDLGGTQMLIALKTVQQTFLQYVGLPEKLLPQHASFSELLWWSEADKCVGWLVRDCF